MPGQVVRIVNNSDVDYRDMFNGTQYLIPAGQALFVEFDAMCLWLGHPDANDYDPRNRTRVAEYQRLRTRYGVNARSLDLSLAGEPVDDKQLFDEMRPKLEVFDTAGNLILTVADDPEGNFLTASVDTNADPSQSLIIARMAQMEQEMSNLRQQLARQQRADQAMSDAQPIGNDNPDLDDNVKVGAKGIIGTIESNREEEEPSSRAPRPKARTTPGEDSPTRVRVSGG